LHSSSQLLAQRKILQLTNSPKYAHYCASLSSPPLIPTPHPYHPPDPLFSLLSRWSTPWILPLIPTRLLAITVVASNRHYS
jgi:hypothetical protein